MKLRLIILVVVAAGLAVAFAVRSASPPKETLQTNTESDDNGDSKLMVRDFELPGDEPEEDADFDVNVRVDKASGKNRLVLEVTEKHGYYAETFQALIWHSGKTGSDPDDSPLNVNYFMNRYLKANETLVDCIDLVPGEVRDVGGDLGADSDWSAEITSYDRARTKNPDTFPPVGGTGKCGVGGS